MSDPKQEHATLEDFAVEQAARIAQLAAEARRLGLIPELPREVIEKLDIGGTMMDLVRLQLKQATAIANLLGPQARNLEKLNAFSAMMARGRTRSVVTKVETATLGADAAFSFVVDNPVDRVQKCSVTLGKLYGPTGERSFTREPNREAENGLLAWRLSPVVEQVEPQELRSFKLQIPLPSADTFFQNGNSYEVTAAIKLSPLGTVSRHLVRVEISP